MAGIRFGSVCSGIEAASVAWEPLGWRAAWFAEIEPFPSAVLKHHYPDTPNLGDMTTLPDRIRLGEMEAPDLFCGGTPCQAFSVAGLRKSLDDARGNLSLTFCEIANAIDDVRRARGDDECIVFWENVPGVLSTADNAFGCFLSALAGCDTAIDPLAATGWTNAGVVAGPQRTVAWRVLDAQYFGLAQRRRRVFVVASARKDFDPVEVLLEFDGVRRDSAPSREAGKVASTLTAPRSGGGGSYRLDAHDVDGGFVQPVCPTLRAGGNQTGGDRPPGTDVDTADSLIPVAFGGGQNCAQTDVSTALHAHPGGSRLDFQTETFLVQPIHTLRGEGFDASEDGTGRGTPLVPVTAVALTASRSSTQCPNEDTTLVPVAQPVAFDTTQLTSASNYSNPKPGDPCHPLAAGAQHGNQGGDIIQTAMQVRRLTPIECERLQGFPDGYTAIPWRNKPAIECPDGPRYKALGNSWAVPVVRWIGERINRVELALELRQEAA